MSICWHEATSWNSNRGNRELKQRCFWAMHVNRKWGLLTIYMLWRQQICIAKFLFSYKDDLLYWTCGVHSKLTNSQIVLDKSLFLFSSWFSNASLRLILFYLSHTQTYCPISNISGCKTRDPSLNVLTQLPFITQESQTKLNCPISGGSRGGVWGAQVPPLFLDENEVQRAEKNFFGRPSPPLSQGLDDCPPPLSEGLDPPLPMMQKVHFRLTSVA